jgi:hypothetical protein
MEMPAEDQRAAEKAAAQLGVQNQVRGLSGSSAGLIQISNRTCYCDLNPATY